ncbi:MAG: hypothetical protein LBP53_03110 [Candidatus Peribacteria bacterium]|jgi:hypothetical protein|nr:hypothetical protein [Candidatus Peribacteria bacterium]
MEAEVEADDEAEADDEVVREEAECEEVSVDEAEEVAVEVLGTKVFSVA